MVRTGGRFTNRRTKNEAVKRAGYHADHRAGQRYSVRSAALQRFPNDQDRVEIVHYIVDAVQMD